MAYQNVTMRPMDSPAAPPHADVPPVDRRALPAGAVVDCPAMADGWPVRRLRLPAAAGAAHRGALLFMGGRADFIEKYLDAIVHWAGRGWHVTAFDWRGQGGSGRLLPDRQVGHIEDFGLWIDDLAAIATAWRADAPAGPHVAVAHSMGGHLLLRALVERRIALDAAVMLSPMFGLNGGLVPAWLGEALASAMCRLGLGRRAAWPDSPASYARMTRLTHDPAHFADELWWRESDSALAQGAPSWRWLQQAYRSTRMLAASPALGAMAVPSLILGTVADQLVLPAAIARVVARLPDADVHLYGGEAAHELLREGDAVRLDALGRIDAFLDARAPVR
ncbi:alpha/beta hydrolase [Sphingobium aquiterrae]|uniref:alpha/beta hydrolase n=1 Tax=Sphingobium aquiterrae TaxID=2038656 RepID=UPI003017A190